MGTGLLLLRWGILGESLTKGSLAVLIFYQLYYAASSFGSQKVAVFVTLPVLR
jgi:hypothetical protein